MKLNQILAIEKGTKASSNRSLTDLHKKSQVASLYEGRERTYTPTNEDGERFPPESQKIQVRSKNVVKEVQAALAELFDITFTKDKANLKATADVVVDGKTIASEVPVTYLLFLEKQLVDLHTFVSKLPVLDPAQSWTWDPGQSAYRTQPVESAKTKKLVKPVVLYEATKEHPAQVKEVSEDVVVGYWKTILYSSALSQDRKDELLDRLAKLQNAVKFAREEANATEANREAISGALFGYLFEDSSNS
jgi:hypothetical protein